MWESWTLFERGGRNRRSRGRLEAEKASHSRPDENSCCSYRSRALDYCLDWKSRSRFCSQFQKTFCLLLCSWQVSGYVVFPKVELVVLGFYRHAPKGNIWALWTMKGSLWSTRFPLPSLGRLHFLIASRSNAVLFSNPFDSTRSQCPTPFPTVGFIFG